MDVKQQTAQFTSQILSNWQEMFNKLTSMINIKAYTVEIMKKTVDEIIALNDGDDVAKAECAAEMTAMTSRVSEMKEQIRKLEANHRKEQLELKGLLEREVHLAHTQRDSMRKEVAVYRTKLASFYSKYQRSSEQKEQDKLAAFMDNMRHEMSQITQENVTMATVTNSLRAIVRDHQNQTHKLEAQNEAMFGDLRELCTHVQTISGETLLTDTERAHYSAANLSQMVSAVTHKALSISSSRSSLHREPMHETEHENDEDDEEEYVNLPSPEKEKAMAIVKACPICEQEFNQMVWKYKCVRCDSYHCSLCAPIRKHDGDGECRVCHVCHHSSANP